MNRDGMTRPCALQRCDQFVGRTMNWLYDHLRVVPRYELAVFTDQLLNRTEFPELKAREVNPQALGRRVWRRISPKGIYPPDAEALRRLGPAVLHSHFGYVGVNDIALQEYLGVPWLVGFYGADVYQLGRRAEWRQQCKPMFARAAAILALGPYMAGQLEALGCPGQKIHVHALGVDTESLPYRARQLHGQEPLRLLFAGTFREKKGIEYVVESAALARKAGVRLNLHVVAEASSKPGDRETKEAVLQKIKELDLGEAVELHPLMQFTDLLSLALECHIFVAPSVTAADGDAEGTPFVLQQMMATGMASLATLHSDIPFVFGELRSLLVPERDAEALAERIIFYAQNPRALEQDGMALREQITKNFNVRAWATRLSELYDQVRQA